MIYIGKKFREIRFTLTLRSTLKKASQKELMIIEQELEKECKRRQKARCKK